MKPPRRSLKIGDPVTFADGRGSGTIRALYGSPAAARNIAATIDTADGGRAAYPLAEILPAQPTSPQSKGDA